MAAATVEFNTAEATSATYEAFIKKIRDAALSSGGTTTRGIAVLPPESAPTKFVLVGLTDDESHFSITLALSAATLNVVACADCYPSTGRGGHSFFLADAPHDARNIIFTDTMISQLSSISSGYRGVDRSGVALGLGPLKKAITELSQYKFGTEVTPEFHNSLVVVQEMVSEAARFKFIEKCISDKQLNSYYPLYDAISYEDNWHELSRQIKGADSSGKFTGAVTLWDAAHNPKVVTSVDDVKGVIALLLCINA